MVVVFAIPTNDILSRMYVCKNKGSKEDLKSSIKGVLFSFIPQRLGLLGTLVFNPLLLPILHQVNTDVKRKGKDLV